MEKVSTEELPIDNQNNIADPIEKKEIVDTSWQNKDNEFINIYGKNYSKQQAYYVLYSALLGEITGNPLQGEQLDVCNFLKANYTIGLEARRKQIAAGFSDWVVEDIEKRPFENDEQSDNSKSGRPTIIDRLSNLFSKK